MSRHNLKGLSIYIDGAAKGNPGPAGIGVVITDSNGTIIKNLSKYIGDTTNNIAEYKALIFGLEEVCVLGVRDVAINTDSELLVKQLGGEYKIKNAVLKELYKRVNNILHSFDEVKINQISRQDNRGADKLANKAVAAGRKRRVGRSFVLKTKEDINTQALLKTGSR